MKQIVGIVLASSLLMSAEVNAWGQIGHRVTGAIAEQYLTEEAQTAVVDLLPNESLAEAATYADEMRSNPDRFWQKEASPYHYVTVPKGKVYSDVGAPGEGDAASALNKFRKTLLDPRATKKQKQLALRFTVHIIGDLHQPLHAGDGTDRGGNDLKIEFFREESNLHRVWDSQMLDRRQLSYSEWSQWLGEKITPTQVKKWSEPNPEVWITESAKIRDTIYPDSDKISWDYLYEQMPTVTLRLQQAGIRIAAYLNEMYSTQQ